MIKFLKIGIFLIIPTLSFAQGEVGKTIDYDGLKMQSGDTISISDLRGKADPIISLPEPVKGEWKIQLFSGEGELLVEESTGDFRVSMKKYVAKIRKYSRVLFFNSGVKLVLYFK